MHALVAALVLAVAPPGEGFPWKFTTSKLPNGFTVTRVPMPSSGLVAYYTVVRVGARNEIEPGKTGFAHFFEHVMFKGTAKWPGSARGEALAKLGFSENATTTDDVTVYHAVGPSSALQTLVELEADRFQRLEYTEQTFATESKAVLGEYHTNAANPGLELEEVLRTTAFTTPSYRHTALGFYEDIQKMPEGYAYSKEFFQRWYTPDNSMLFVAGEFDDAKLMAWVTEAYGGWKGKAAQLASKPEPEQTAPKEAKVEWPHQTLPRHAQYFKVPPSTVEDGAVMTVLAAYLAGETSPLYKQLVLEQQRAQTVYIDYGGHRDPFLFGLVAVLKDEKHRAEVDAAFTAAIAEVAAGKVDAKRVEQIEQRSRYSTPMGLETPSQVASTLAFTAGGTGLPDGFDRQLRLIAKVKPAQLVAFAKKHLTAAHRTTLQLVAKEAK
ncbi:MAG: pitrilysin family protein [Myxococcaceae bacterium]